MRVWTVLGCATMIGALSWVVGCSSKRPTQVPPGGTEGDSLTCTDGKDNDGDGLSDCADPGCAAVLICKRPIPDAGPPALDATSVEPPVVPNQKDHHFNVGDQVADVDLLFVVDNSASMGEEQRNLRTNFASLVDALRDHTLGQDGSGKPCTQSNTLGCKIPNVHIGVISSDVGAGNYNLPSCESAGGDKGRLQSKPRIAGCTPPSQPWIAYTQGTTNVPAGSSDPIERTKAAFSCIARLGTSGCGFEQPLKSARWALDPARNVNPGFLRKNAVLAIVFITDEDDCSADNPQLYDPSQQSLTDTLGPLTSFRCFEFGVTCDVNDRNRIGSRKNCKARAGTYFADLKKTYIDFFHALKPPGRLVIGAIAGPTQPVAVGKSGNNPVLKGSCQSNMGVAVPAIRLKALVDSVGAAGRFSSICNADLLPALKEIGQAVSSARGKNCLLPLKDMSPQPGLQPNCVVEDLLGSVRATLPKCTDSSCKPCPCWRVVRRPDCASGSSLEVQRGGPPAPGTLIRARCQGVGP